MSSLTYNNDKSIAFDVSTKTFYLLRDISFNIDRMDDFTSINTPDGPTREKVTSTIDIFTRKTYDRYSKTSGNFYDRYTRTNCLMFVLRAGYTFNGLGRLINISSPSTKIKPFFSDIFLTVFFNSSSCLTCGLLL